VPKPLVYQTGSSPGSGLLFQAADEMPIVDLARMSAIATDRKWRFVHALSPKPTFNTIGILPNE
jgi:hypothetical protein